MGKLKVTGIVLTTVAVIAIIAVLIMSFVLPMGFWMGAEKAKNSYDDWANSASFTDQITVSGKLAEKEEDSLLGLTIYSYKFEGCEEGFLSSEDIGDEGSIVMVTIEMRELGPEVYSQTNSFAAWIPNICCGGLSIIVVIIGLILLLVGLKKDKKAALMPPPQEPMPEGDPQYENQNLYGAPQQAVQGQPLQATPQPVQQPAPAPQQPPMDPIEAAKKRQLELNQKIAMMQQGQPPRQ